MEAPLVGRSHLERFLDCSDALESSVAELIERAVALGWTHDEVATALINLAAILIPDMDNRKDTAVLAPVSQH